MIDERLIRHAIAAASLLVTVSNANAACIPNASTLEAREAFKAEPGSLLKRFPFGSGGLVGEVRNLVVSDPALIAVTVGLLPSANARQKTAIAGGLAQAARACSTTDQAAALDIQQAVAALPDAEVQTAFAVATGETLTTAIGAAAASGPAASGNGGGTPGSGSGGGTRSIESSTPRAAQAFTYSGGSGLLLSTSGNTSSPLVLNASTPTSVAGQ